MLVKETNAKGGSRFQDRAFVYDPSDAPRLCNCNQADQNDKASPLSTEHDR
jgi:hypothetical protein